MELLNKNLSEREAAAILGCSRNTVSEIKELCRRQGLTWDDIQDMTDDGLYDILYPNPDKPEKILQFLHISSTIKKNVGGCVADKIYGTITCYDRMIIQGYIPGWSHAEGMTGYLNANNIRIFDFSNFSQTLTEQIRANAQRIADENGIENEFIPFDDHSGGKENLTKVTDSVVGQGALLPRTEFLCGA